MMIVETAPAKLNLYLHVVGRRPDGYHRLDSLVAFASIGDTITVSAGGGCRLEVDGPLAEAVPAGADNLVLRAARALADAAGRDPDVTIRLTKRLPVAAGIGGGSADAAAVIRALSALWGLSVADPVLAAVALSLGADVPVCLRHGTWYVGGIGEELSPAPPLAGQPLVLVNPGQPVPTPAVFAARHGAFSDPDRFDQSALRETGPVALLAGRRNDLSDAARSLCPAIGDALEALASLPGCRLARMSGSGATCFGLFTDGDAAAAGADLIRRSRPQWWVADAVIL